MVKYLAQNFENLSEEELLNNLKDRNEQLDTLLKELKNQDLLQMIDLTLDNILLLTSFQKNHTKNFNLYQQKFDPSPSFLQGTEPQEDVPRLLYRIFSKIESAAVKLLYITTFPQEDLDAIRKKHKMALECLGTFDTRMPGMLETFEVRNFLEKLKPLVVNTVEETEIIRPDNDTTIGEPLDDSAQGDMQDEQLAAESALGLQLMATTVEVKTPNMEPSDITSMSFKLEAEKSRTDPQTALRKTLDSTYSGNDSDDEFIKYIRVKSKSATNPDPTLADLLKRASSRRRQAKTVEDMVKIITESMPLAVENEQDESKETNTPRKRLKLARKLSEVFEKFNQDFDKLQETQQHKDTIYADTRKKLEQIYRAAMNESPENDEAFGVPDDEIHSDPVSNTILDQRINAAIKKITNIKNDLYAGIIAIDPKNPDVPISNEKINDYQNDAGKTLEKLTLKIPQSGGSSEAISCHFNQETNKDTNASQMTMSAPKDELNNTDDLALKKMVIIFIESAIKKGFNTVTAGGLYDENQNPILFDKDKTAEFVEILDKYCTAAGLNLNITNCPERPQPTTPRTDSRFRP